MDTKTAKGGNPVGGLLDPTFDRSYYSLVHCPRLGYEVDLEEHRACANYSGLHVEPDTGAHLLYCGFGLD